MISEYPEEKVSDEKLNEILIRDISELGSELEKLHKQGVLPPSLVQFKPSHWPAYREFVNRNSGENPSS